MKTSELLILLGIGGAIAYYFYQKTGRIAISAPALPDVGVPLLNITLPSETATGTTSTSNFLLDLLNPLKTTTDIFESLTGSAINETAPGAGFQGAVLGDWLTPDKGDTVHFTQNGAVKSEKAPYSGIIWEPVFIAASAKYTIPNGVLSRLAWQESRYNPNAVSIDGAIGITQIIPQYYPQWSANDLYDPNKEIFYTAQILRDNFNKYQNWPQAIVAYNQGPGTVDKAIANAVAKNDVGNWLNYSPIGPVGRDYANIAKDTGLT